MSQLQNELCPRSVASKLSERRPPTWIARGGNENSQNFAFFCILSISRNFDVASYIRGGTMWKLTSWGFRKCGTFWGLELLKRSYRRSESDDSEIFDLSPKISGVQKKGKSSEFNPQDYEKVKSSPALTVWSHESVKDCRKTWFWGKNIIFLKIQKNC